MIACCALLIALALVPAQAAEILATIGHDGEPVPASTATPISLDLQEADIRSVLRLFGRHAHLNFVLDDSVQGTVTVKLVEVPWDLALAAILASKGLAAMPMAPQGQPAAVWVVEPLGE